MLQAYKYGKETEFKILKLQDLNFNITTEAPTCLVFGSSKE